MEAHEAYRAGNIDTALLKYAMLAELGYEVAQSNVAFILDHGKFVVFIQTVLAMACPSSSIVSYVCSMHAETSLHMSQMAHQAGAYLWILCITMPLVVFLLFPGCNTLVHHRVTNQH